MEYFLNPKIGFIGAGEISRFHIQAAHHVGFQLHAICGRKGSANASSLAREYGFENDVKSLEELMNSKLDAIVICAKTDQALDLYKEVLELNLPILIEKPVTTSAGNFLSITDLDRNETLVGYNRRFYSSIQQLKSEIKEKSNLFSNWSISEMVGREDSSSEIFKKVLVENSVHIFDLMRYLHGDYEVLEVKSTNIQNGPFFAAASVKFTNQSLATINLTFGTPRNTSLELYTESSSYLLKPIENFEKASQIEIIEPSDATPIRRYSPVIDRSWRISGEDLDFKPGFLRQYREFMGIVHGEKRVTGASLRDAMEASKLAEFFISAGS